MELQPALVMLTAERVNVKRLVKTDAGYAVDPDALFAHIGDVTTYVYVNSNGMNTKGWLAWTVADVTLGPFTTRKAAVEALLEGRGLRAADAAETMQPLF